MFKVVYLVKILFAQRHLNWQLKWEVVDQDAIAPVVGELTDAEILEATQLSKRARLEEDDSLHTIEKQISKERINRTSQKNITNFFKHI